MFAFFDDIPPSPRFSFGDVPLENRTCIPLSWPSSLMSSFPLGYEAPLFPLSAFFPLYFPRFFLSFLWQVLGCGLNPVYLPFPCCTHFQICSVHTLAVPLTHTHPFVLLPFPCLVPFFCAFFPFPFFLPGSVDVSLFFFFHGIPHPHFSSASSRTLFNIYGRFVPSRQLDNRFKRYAHSSRLFWSLDLDADSPQTKL